MTVSISKICRGNNLAWGNKAFLKLGVEQENEILNYSMCAVYIKV